MMELFIKEIWRYDPDAGNGGKVPEVFLGGNASVFKDDYPLRIISETSLQYLNARLGSDGPVPTNWFYPHIVLSGLRKPFDEDHIEALSANDVHFFAEVFCALPERKAGDAEVSRINEKIIRAAAHRKWTFRGECKFWFGRYFRIAGSGRIYEGMRLRKLA